MCCDGFLCEHFFYFCDWHFSKLVTVTNWRERQSDSCPHSNLFQFFKKRGKKAIVNNKMLNILSLCHTLTWNLRKSLRCELWTLPSDVPPFSCPCLPGPQSSLPDKITLPRIIVNVQKRIILGCLIKHLQREIWPMDTCVFFFNPRAHTNKEYLQLLQLHTRWNIHIS